MKVRFGRYPGGRLRALTLSYDDGVKDDRRLVEIMNRYGIRGTFHLNSGKLGDQRFVDADEVAELYRGHEVSCHSLTHAYLDRIPAEELIYEMHEDRRILEDACGYVVRGMSYPCNTWSPDVIERLRVLGLHYGRTTEATGGFGLPHDFMRWNPTAHHSGNIIEKLTAFRRAAPMPLFYVWGHSYEFDRNNNWDLIENFCREAGGDEDTWYATNIEIYDYITALRSLDLSVDRTAAFNPSAMSVWVELDGEPVEIPAGRSVRLK